MFRLSAENVWRPRAGVAINFSQRPTGTCQGRIVNIDQIIGRRKRLALLQQLHSTESHFRASSHYPCTGAAATSVHVFQKAGGSPTPPRFVKFISRAYRHARTFHNRSYHDMCRADERPILAARGNRRDCRCCVMAAGTISLVPPNAGSLERSPPMLPTIETVGTILGAR